MSNYTFRNWVRDVMIWSILNADLSDSRKAAAVIAQLTGAAAEYAREIPGPVLMGGVAVNGVPVDPLTYVMHQLAVFLRGFPLWVFFVVLLSALRR